MKREQFFDVAERMYVTEQCTLERIASELNLAERTVRNWKAEGDWERKRAELLKTQTTFHAELYEFARKLMRSISMDLDSQDKDVQGRLNAMTRLLDKLPKTKEYEDAVKVDKSEENAKERSVSPEVITEKVKEILGA